MSADPNDIARFTSDGVTVTASDPALRENHPDAVDETTVIDTHFDAIAGGEFILRERFAFLSMTGRLHDAVELGSQVGFGAAVPIVPVLPSFYVIDQRRDISSRAIVRSYGFDYETDRYPVELVGAPNPEPVDPPITFDTANVKFDSGRYEMDQTTSP